mgnify:CR=1 FL=1
MLLLLVLLLGDGILSLLLLLFWLFGMEIVRLLLDGVGVVGVELLAMLLLVVQPELNRFCMALSCDSF